MTDILDLEIIKDDLCIDEEVSIAKLKEKARKRKGRGFDSHITREEIGNFETLSTSEPDADNYNAQRSVEGWILMVTGIHEEAHEEDIEGPFSEFGIIKNLQLNVDRKTGFVKGYALIEYAKFAEAKAAKMALDKSELLGNMLAVDWAFVKQPLKVRRFQSRLKVL